jgi:signal peptidase I
MSEQVITFEDRLLTVLVADLQARGSRLGPVDERRTRRGVAWPALVAAALVVIAAVVTGSGSGGAVTVAVASISMEPTLHPGDVVSVDTTAYATAPTERGDIVAFRRPDFPDHVSFLRVIGVPGDTVEESDGVVSVNGTPLDEPYASPDHRSGTWTVDPGHLFLMGDNRAHANDSRLDGFAGALGQVPLDAVIGRVTTGDVGGTPDIPAGPAPAVAGPGEGQAS